MFIKIEEDCPICGSQAILKDKYLKGSANKKNWWVVCTGCGYRTQDRNKSRKAIEEWNNKAQVSTFVTMKKEKKDMEKAILIINGKEIEVKIEMGDTENKGIQIIVDEKTVEELSENFKFNKKTGYEKETERYYTISTSGRIEESTNIDSIIDKIRYEEANFYSSKEVALNNARADKLMRQLRRFAVEHRKSNIDWNNKKTYKYYIYFNHSLKQIEIEHICYSHDIGIYFDTQEHAQLALDTFYNELIWYFTEYKDSL